MNVPGVLATKYAYALLASSFHFNDRCIYFPVKPYILSGAEKPSKSIHVSNTRFVIFNNGASMNITVELSGSDAERKVIITQKGGSNALVLMRVLLYRLLAHIR